MHKCVAGGSSAEQTTHEFFPVGLMAEAFQPNSLSAMVIESHVVDVLRLRRIHQSAPTGISPSWSEIPCGKALRLISWMCSLRDLKAKTPFCPNWTTPRTFFKVLAILTTSSRVWPCIATIPKRGSGFLLSAFTWRNTPACPERTKVGCKTSSGILTNPWT